MRSFVVSAWLLLFATAEYVPKVNGALGDTPLIKAVNWNNLELVKRLLDNGADAKATNSYGNTALMSAAVYGTNELVELLLPKSNAKATNNNGRSTLMYAAYRGRNKMVELLLPKSDAKATENDGYTALMYAAKYGSYKAKSMELLLPKSDANLTTNFGICFFLDIRS